MFSSDATLGSLLFRTENVYEKEQRTLSLILRACVFLKWLKMVKSPLFYFEANSETWALKGSLR